MVENISGRVGGRIREYRKKANMTQESLALAAGIGVSFLGDVERGVKRASIETLEKVLGVLGVSFEEFFNFGTEITPYKESSALEKLNTELRNLPEETVESIYEIVMRILYMQR